MKTLANCSNGEFFKQMAKITNKFKKYKDVLKEAQTEDGKTNLIDLIYLICGENYDDTNEILGMFLFMSGKEFENLSPENTEEDSFVMINKILRSERAEAIKTMFR